MKTKRPKVPKPDIRERARAAGCWLNARRSNDGNVPKSEEMAAFMAIFHPEIKGRKLAALLHP